MAYTPMEMAEAFIKTGELAEALEALDARLTEAPGDDEARRLRSAVLLRMPGDDPLRAAAADCAALASPTAEDHTRRSVALERLGDGADAVAAMEAARALDGGERPAERLVQLLMAQGRLVSAGALVAGMPRTWRWRQWAGDIAALLGDDSTATARYGLALAQIETRFDPADRWGQAIRARLLLARANAYRRMGLGGAAAADYAAAAALVPDDPAIPFCQGLLRARDGDLDAGLALCRGALEAASAAVRAELLAMLDDDEADAGALARLRAALR